MFKQFQWRLIVATVVAICFSSVVLVGTTLSTDQPPGTYPIEFKYTDEAGQEHSTTINWTLTYPHTVVSYPNKEAINAQDKIVKAGTLEIYTSKDFILALNATAWSIENGSTIPITTVDVQAIPDQADAYHVMFATGLNTSTTVTIKEFSTDVLGLKEEYIYTNVSTEQEIRARNYFILLSGGIILLPLLYLILIYVLASWQTTTVKKLLCKKKSK